MRSHDMVAWYMDTRTGLFFPLLVSYFLLVYERVFSYDNTWNGLAYIAYHFLVERLDWSWISFSVYIPLKTGQD